MVTKTPDYADWFSQLGVSNAPLTRDGLITTLQFLHEKMPKLPQEKIKDFLKGIDLHKQVKRITLESGATVAAFRQPTEDPLKLFYTKAGSSVHRLGVHPAQRRFHRYRVTSPVEVLASRTAGIVDTWTIEGSKHIAEGGDLQYIIPNANLYLTVLR